MENKKSFLLPITVGAGLTALVAVIALTNLFDPLIDYIHENSITPLGAILCIIFGIAAFYGVFKILSKLGNNMLPDAEDDKK